MGLDAGVFLLAGCTTVVGIEFGIRWLRRRRAEQIG